MKRFLILFFCILVLIALPAYGKEAEVTEEYMEDSGFYRYYVGDSYIESTVRLGIVVPNVVRLTYGKNVEVTLYKGSEVQNFSSGGLIYGEGNYSLIIKNGDLTGTIDFKITNPTNEDMSFEDDFYNAVKFTQEYDNQRQMYRETMGDYYSLYANVPNNAVTNRAVKIYCTLNENITISAEKDGEEISFSSGKTFSDPGYYSVNVVYDGTEAAYEEDVSNITESDLSDFSESNMENAQAYTAPEDDPIGAVADVAQFRFYIVGGPQNKLNYINAPQDYEVAGITLNGKKVKVDNKSFFKAEEDGTYKVSFKAVKAGLPDYSFSYERDRTSPSASFEGVGRGGIAENDVVYNISDKNSEVKITSNNITMDFENNVIDKNGLYKIEVKDKAGNFNTYLINVDKPYYIGFVFILAIIIAAGVGVVLYIRYVKNNIRVR